MRQYGGRVEGAGTVASARAAWPELPSRLRSEIEQVVGDRVVAVTDIPVGFSPGLLARLDLQNEEPVFVKIASAAVNARTPLMHLREGEVLAALDSEVPAARLIGTIRHEDWAGIATVFEPGTPPDASEGSLAAAFSLCDALAASPIPSGLAPHSETLADDFLWFGLRRLMERDGHLPSDWANRRSAELLRSEGGLLPALDGGCLVHGDLRADNVLINPGGQPVAVDWPAASIGNPLFDVLTLVTSIAALSQQPVSQVPGLSLRLANAPADTVNTLLVGLYGHYLWASTLGHPPGIPGVRAYQGQLAAVLEEWLISRLER